MMRADSRHKPARSPVVLSGAAISMGEPGYVIAEAGVNHNGDPDMAAKLVEAAARAGAQAVKFQTFSATRLAIRHAPQAEYQRLGAPGDSGQQAMLRRLELPAESYDRLQQLSRRLGLLFLSSPFDEESADFLERLGVEAYKVPSGELTNLNFLAHLARKGRPLIISTGMANLGEVEAALAAVARNGNPPHVLLHCTSEYPCPPQDANLRAMATLASAFGMPVGFSDHSEGIELALAAVALGACIVEKHFTLDRSLPGPDHAASLEPEALAAMTAGIKRIRLALGSGRKCPSTEEMRNAVVVRKSWAARVPLAAGTLLTEEALVLRRPGTGLPSAALPWLLGRTVRVDIAADTLLDRSMLF